MPHVSLLIFDFYVSVYLFLIEIDSRASAELVLFLGLPFSLCIHFLGKFDSSFCKQFELIRIYLI